MSDVLGTMLYVKPLRLRKYGLPFIVCEAQLWFELTPLTIHEG